jgi:hypothetical protein
MTLGQDRPGAWLSGYGLTKSVLNVIFGHRKVYTHFNSTICSAEIDPMTITLLHQDIESGHLIMRWLITFRLGEVSGRLEHVNKWRANHFPGTNHCRGSLCRIHCIFHHRFHTHIADPSKVSICTCPHPRSLHYERWKSGDYRHQPSTWLRRQLLFHPSC